MRALVRIRLGSLVPSAPVALLLLLFGLVLLHTAWICDDAYISFRTIDNLLHGYGLRWNVAERVQSFTHPLWVLALSAAAFVTRELYYTTLAISIGLSLATLWIVAARLARGTASAALAIIVLTLSKAFVDFSTSGLENALTHLLLALFLLRWFTHPRDEHSLRWLSAIAALAMVNRMDTALLYLPALVYAARAVPWRRALPRLALGMLPFVVWELFALVYYGTPFPNTAYAKLTTGADRAQLIVQGAHYVVNSLLADPLTLVAIVAAAIAVATTRVREQLAALAGVWLYLAYVVYIGGDFMSGRFFTAPLLVSVAVLSRHELTLDSRRGVAALAAAILLGFASPSSSFLGGSEYGANNPDWKDDRGIADERRFYYPHLGLLRAGDHQNLFEQEGRELRAAGTPVAQTRAAGVTGFYAGPDVHIVDVFGLGDPLLARLPPRYTARWRIGHYRRFVPDGYLETLRTGHNVLADRELAAYYDKLALVTRGPLFSAERWAAIWELNTGQLDHLIDRERYYHPTLQRGALAGDAWRAAGGLQLTRDGFELDLGGAVRASALELSLRGGGISHVDLYVGDELIQRLELATERLPAGAAAQHTVPLPARELTRVHVVPLSRFERDQVYPVLDAISLDR